MRTFQTISVFWLFEGENLFPKWKSSVFQNFAAVPRSLAASPQASAAFFYIFMSFHLLLLFCSLFTDFTGFQYFPLHSNILRRFHAKRRIVWCYFSYRLTIPIQTPLKVSILKMASGGSWVNSLKSLFRALCFIYLCHPQSLVWHQSIE